MLAALWGTRKSEKQNKILCMKKEEEEEEAPKKKKKKKKNVFVFLLFFAFKNKKGKGNGLERCRMSSVQKRKTGIHPSVCFFSSIPGRTTLREQRKKKRKKKREHMTCLTSFTACVVVVVVQRGFQSAWLCYSPTPPPSLSSKKGKKRTLSHQRNILLT